MATNHLRGPDDIERDITLAEGTLHMLAHSPTHSGGAELHGRVKARMDDLRAEMHAYMMGVGWSHSAAGELVSLRFDGVMA